MAATQNEIEKADNSSQYNHLERLNTAEASNKMNDARISALTTQEQKKLVHRVDKRLVLTLGVLFCVSLIDRTNTPLAMVAGMDYDLTLTGARYNIIILVFFVPYTILQPLATIMLRKIGPSIFLPTISLLWGAVMLGSGFVHKWIDLIAIRILIGVLEAGFFPGCAYLLSCWYPRYDLQKRNAIFYVVGTVASAFSGILSYGLSQMAGLGSGDRLGQSYGPTLANPELPSGRLPGIAGWRWIFIIHGAFTCAVALLAYFTIVDFPEYSSSKFLGRRFLNEKEMGFIVARIEKDRQDAMAEKFILKDYLKNALDLNVWAFATIFGCTAIQSYALAYFLPIILKDGMGFGTAASQCLIAPPYVSSGLLMILFGWAADKYHIRSPFIIGCGCMGLIGLPILGFTHNVALRYFGAFLATLSGNANVPAVLTWQANNIRGQWRRAFCSATLIGAGGIGGIIGSTTFRTQDAPEYHAGIYTCIIASALVVVITLLLGLKFWRANKRASNGGKIIEGLIGFRYTL